MHIHNAIVVLQEILPVFPVAAVNSASGKAISEAMAKCIELEHREDLKILAGAYHARFQKVKAVWEAPQAPVVSISKVYRYYSYRHHYHRLDIQLRLHLVE